MDKEHFMLRWSMRVGPGICPVANWGYNFMGLDLDFISST